MKQRSLLSVVLLFIFSVVGFCSNAVAVIYGSMRVATIAALIYVFPLLIDAIEELSTMYIRTLIQRNILVISMYIGIIYLLLILGYWALQIGNIAVTAGNLIDLGNRCFRATLAGLPAVYTVGKLYDLKIVLKQNENVAKAYSKES